VLAKWMAPVYETAGLEPPELERNLMQSRLGGYDIVGLDWLALEVKRQEQAAVGTWWRQTVRQASEGQVPFLMWRQNRRPWRFRVRVRTAHGAGDLWAHHFVDADLGLEEAEQWFQMELWWRLQREG